MTTRPSDGSGKTASSVGGVPAGCLGLRVSKTTTDKSGGKTSKISVDIRSNRLPETVQVQLFKSVPGGYQPVATSVQTLPTRNRVTTVAFSYTFTPDDAAIGKVTFRAVVSILGGRDALKYYEAGMDLGLSRNIEESFRLFQGRILEEYEAMINEMGFHVIDATKSIEAQQKEMRRIVLQEFGRVRPPGVLGTEVRVAELSQ